MVVTFYNITLQGHYLVTVEVWFRRLVSVEEVISQRRKTCRWRAILV